MESDACEKLVTSFAKADSSTDFQPNVDSLPSVIVDDAKVKLLCVITRDDPMVTDVSNAGLDHLKGLTNLQELRLFGTQVSDAGLAHLKGLSKLQTLDLGYTQVSDEGLAHLKGLTNLQTLRLDLTQVTDADLVHLKGLTNLRNLALQRTQVTDSGVKKLQKALPNCKIEH